MFGFLFFWRSFIDAHLISASITYFIRLLIKFLDFEDT